MIRVFRNDQLIRALRPEFLNSGGGGGGAIAEGPGIDIVAPAAVGLGGDTILLYQANGNPVAEFAASSAGIIAAAAAAVSGDTIVLPSRTISVTNALTLVAGTAITGMGLKSKLSMTALITLAGSNLLSDLWINSTANDANDLIGIQDGGNDNEIGRCRIVATQSGAGNAYAIKMSNAGTITCRECYIEGTVGGIGVGYAGYWVDGSLYVIGGEVKGSVARQPFNVM